MSRHVHCVLGYEKIAAIRFCHIYNLLGFSEELIAGLFILHIALNDALGRLCNRCALIFGDVVELEGLCRC